MFNLGRAISNCLKTTATPMIISRIGFSSENVRKTNKKIEKVVGRINPKFGGILKKQNEKVENLIQIKENFEDATNPLSILTRTLRSREEAFKYSDHLYVQRLGYTHHGVYMGNGTVIHYMRDVGIVKVSLEEFAGKAKIHIKPSYKEYDDAEIIVRAYSRLGEGKYNLFQNNCEHFVAWCRSGRYK